MCRMLALLAIYGAGFAPAADESPIATTAAAQVQANDDQSARISIQGRVVNVEVEAFRDLSPSIQRNGGDLRIQVRLSTLDNRGLPAIGTVNVQIDNGRRTPWRTIVAPFPTFAQDPKSTIMGASGGPRWAVGSRLGVRVEIRSGNRTYIARVPATISAVY